jgi:glycosyltransferase involved in cell wall biosynthesis
MILIPAYNEGGAIRRVVTEVQSLLPQTPILVLDDCSTDDTRTEALAAGADVISVPYHLGLGGCVQAGYRYAYDAGFSYVIRIDGDGQHDPRFIPDLFAALRDSPVQMVIGSRYLNGKVPATSFARGVGIWFFRQILRLILEKEVHDPTSGFVGVNRQALEVFARSFPLEYPEIEALVVLQRRQFQFAEVPVVMRRRMAGVSTITALKSFYYILHVLLGVIVNILKYEGERRKG